MWHQNLGFGVRFFLGLGVLGFKVWGLVFDPRDFSNFVTNNEMACSSAARRMHIPLSARWIHISHYTRSTPHRGGSEGDKDGELPHKERGGGVGAVAPVSEGNEPRGRDGQERRAGARGHRLGSRVQGRGVRVNGL